MKSLKVLTLLSTLLFGVGSFAADRFTFTGDCKFKRGGSETNIGSFQVDVPNLSTKTMRFTFPGDTKEYSAFAQLLPRSGNPPLYEISLGYRWEDSGKLLMRVASDPEAISGTKLRFYEWFVDVDGKMSLFSCEGVGRK
jgi:hypothetical protein